jgi:uncharacterized membrane protein YdjX (TVP38/TMEM64 family)
VPLIPFVLIGELPGERWLSAHDANAWRFALTGSALLAADVLLPIPSSLVGTMLGARLGFLPGTVAAFAGMTAGQFVAYAASRLLFARSTADSKAMLSAPTAIAVFLSRPVPVFAEALAIAAGATGLAPARFAAACAAGNLIYAMALAGNGAALLPGSLLGPGLALPMLLPVAGWLAWRRWSR